MKKTQLLKYDKSMKHGIIIAAVLVLLAVACSFGSNSNNSGPMTNQGDQTLTDNTLPATSPEDNSNTIPTATLGPDCYGDEIHPIGESIATLYEDTSYEEVMVWFCNGFLFEDILTALQTAEQTGLPAQELLNRFENGQTWEQIWVDIGLLEE